MEPDPRYNRQTEPTDCTVITVEIESDRERVWFSHPLRKLTTNERSQLTQILVDNGVELTVARREEIDRL